MNMFLDTYQILTDKEMSAFQTTESLKENVRNFFKNC